MARWTGWMAFCGLFFSAVLAFAQTTPPTWPNANPVRPDTQPDRANPPPYQPNNQPGNPYPQATPSNNPPNNQFVPAAQPGGPAGNRSQPQNQPTRPDQPVTPQNPTLERRMPLQQAQQAAPPPPPFLLTEAQLAEVDKMLNVWEQKSRNVKTFDSSFVRWEYDLTFPVRDPNAPPNAQPLPNNKDQGILKYAMPDKGVYHIIYTDRNGKWESAPPERIEHWICDGKSVYEYKYPTDPKKPGQVLEHPLPPEMKGKAIADGPLPFLFGAEAAKLRLRYYLRIITPADVQNEVWLEAYPKLPQDAANFSRAILCLNLPDMLPKALRLFLPGGKNYNSYQFFDIVINDKLRIFKGDPFQAFTPPGWQKITDPSPPQNAPSTQAARPLAPAR